MWGGHSHRSTTCGNFSFSCAIVQQPWRHTVGLPCMPCTVKQTSCLERHTHAALCTQHTHAALCTQHTHAALCTQHTALSTGDDGKRETSLVASHQPTHAQPLSTSITVFELQLLEATRPILRCNTQCLLSPVCLNAPACRSSRHHPLGCFVQPPGSTAWKDLIRTVPLSPQHTSCPLCLSLLPHPSSSGSHS